MQSNFIHQNMIYAIKLLKYSITMFFVILVPKNLFTAIYVEDRFHGTHHYGLIKNYIQEKRISNATFVDSLLLKLCIWKITQGYTQERNHIDALRVECSSLNHHISRTTKELTAEKNLTFAKYDILSTFIFYFE